MDHKSWLWRKKSTEKIAVANDKVDVSTVENEEVQKLLDDKAELENNMKNLNVKLSSALSECDANEDLVKKLSKAVQEARAGCEKAETKAASLKKELDEALRHRAAGEERLTHLDAALKECMQQLRFVREEQEQRIHDAVIKTSKEFEKAQMILEEKLAETNKRLSKIAVDNTHLSKALLVKEKLIDDLSKQKAQLEANFNTLKTRLESTEKDSASLKYEVRVLEKELEIRNEEREFNRRTAEASHKHHLESVKKIAKLELECQRLRLLVRKRLPGPAALAKMKSEVEILGRDSFETRRRMSNSSQTALLADFTVENSPETPSKKINFLAEQLCAMEEENKALKEALNKKANDLQFLRAMYARTTSKLPQVESHFDEVSKDPTTLEPSRSSLISHELFLASMSDFGSDDKVSCAGSGASALISELEHYKHGQLRGSPSTKTIGTSDISLMDDFVEMERLAVVSVDKQSGSPDDANANARSLETDLTGYSPEATGGEIISVAESGSGISNQEIKFKDILLGNAPDWLKEILQVVFKQNRITRRKPLEMLEDVRAVLANIDNANPDTYVDRREKSKQHDASNSHQVGGNISWKPTEKSLAMDSSGGITNVDVLSTYKSNHLFQSDIGKSISKIIEVIEGIISQYPDYGNSDTLPSKNGSVFPYKNTETASGYMVRVFQWKTSELSAVLQQFVHTSYDLLNGKSDVGRFAQELNSTLDWIMNHCFSLQDVSTMRDAIIKRFDWDESRSEGEAEAGITGQFSEQLSRLPMVASSNGHRNYYEKDELYYNSRDENKNLKDQLINIESAKKDLEGRFQSAMDKSESLANQLQESDKTILSLRTELDNLKGSKAIVENQIEDHKLIKEDLDTQLSVAKVELNEARQKFSSLEVELENKSCRCEELEATCLELQLQLESLTKKAIPNCELHQEEKQLRTDWEITAASEKLAECQETILNLGKQLKALAPPKEAALFDKVISAPADTNSSNSPAASSALIAPENMIMNQRSSLLDRMLAEDNADTKSHASKVTENPSSVFISSGVLEPLEKILILNGSKHQDDVTTNSLALVPSKKSGGSLWRKLFWRRKKSYSKKQSLPFPPRTDLRAE